MSGSLWLQSTGAEDGPDLQSSLQNTRNRLWASERLHEVLEILTDKCNMDEINIKYTVMSRFIYFVLRFINRK